MPMNISLISHSRTWELQYEESKRVEFGCLEKSAGFLLSAIVWPAFILISPVFVAYNIGKYVKHGLKQAKAVKILKDENQNQLQQYGASRVAGIERKIEKLKERAKNSIESHLRKNNLGPFGRGTCKIGYLLESIGLQGLSTVPEQTGNKLPKDYWNKLPKDYWKNLNWDDYLAKDFFAISKAARPCDTDICQTLHAFQVKYHTLLRQKEALATGNDNEKLEKVRKIAELSFVKHGFKKQATKEWLLSPLLWALPTGGMFWFLYSSTNERVLLENKKEHVKAVSSLQQYVDLVKAHNELIKNRDYLVPYRRDFSFEK